MTVEGEGEVRRRFVGVGIDIIADESGTPVGQPTRLLPDGDALQAAPELPGPGIYRITIKGAGPAGFQVSPITNLVLAWPTENHLGPLA